LRASSKAILSWVVLRARGGPVVNLVGYRGNYPLWTGWEEPDRHCWRLLTTSPSGGNNPAKTPARVDDMEWFFSMTTPDQTLQTWLRRPFRNRLGVSSTSVLLSGPYHIGLPPLPLSIHHLSGVSFNNNAELQNWLDDYSRLNRRISSSVGTKTCPNVGKQSWIIEENTVTR
jgi:hypothetical protein